MSAPQSVTATFTLLPTAPDFTLSSVPPATLAAGASTTVPETVTPLNGFNETVTFDYENWPEGFAADFGPNPVAATATTQITVSTETGVAAGTYQLPITGTGGSVNHENYISVTVSGVPAPDYKLGVPPPQRVTAGRSVSFRENVWGIGGLNARIHLKLVGLPAGAWYTLSPPDPWTNGSTLVTIGTSSATPLGTYTVIICGLDSSHPVSFALTVTNCPTLWCGCAYGSILTEVNAAGTGAVTLGTWIGDADLKMVQPYYRVQAVNAYLHVPNNDGYDGGIGPPMWGEAHSELV
jgi:hypothetical protein